jgi:hypothetical protein
VAIDTRYDGNEAGAATYQPLQHAPEFRHRISHPRELGNHKSSRVACRELSKSIFKARPLKRALVRPLPVAYNLQQRQPAPLTVIRDLVNLPPQVPARALPVFRIDARVAKDNRFNRSFTRTRRGRASSRADPTE